MIIKLRNFLRFLIWDMTKWQCPDCRTYYVHDHGWISFNVVCSSCEALDLGGKRPGAAEKWLPR